MTSAAYIERAIRPDLALFASPSRSMWGRLVYHRADRALFRLVEDAPKLTRDNIMALALAWTYRYILPVSYGPAHIPQTVPQTLAAMAGDCDEGAVLLGSLVVSLDAAAADRMRVVVLPAYAGRYEHCVLDWTDCDGKVWRADWTESGELMA